MTPSELSAIRVECAEAMGTPAKSTRWEYQYDDGANGRIWSRGHRSKDAALNDAATHLRNVPKMEEYEIDHRIPEYCSDANVALTLAKALADEGWDMTHKRAASQPEHLVYFEKGCGMTYEHHYATAPTFALALSMAFLAVHRSKKA